MVFTFMDKKLILYFLFTLFFPVLAEAQVAVKGIVKSDEGPLPGATVQLIELGKGTITDGNGKFEIKDVPSGKYMLEVRSIGFKAINKSVNVPETNFLNIQLEPSVLGLESVVVTGTMQPVFISQSPIKVEVITADHLKTYIPTASAGIMEGISLINGVQEVVACGVCFTNSISINGLPGAYTAVLIDGTPIFGNLASVYGLNGIPEMIIDRFEVIKGPNSTLYGSEAVAGVINIITKDPQEQPFFSVDLMGTTHLESFGNISIAPKVGKHHGFIGINYAYINDFDDNNNDGFGDMINLDRLSFFTKWKINRQGNKDFSVAAKLYYEDRRNGVEEYLEDRNYKHLRGSDKIYGESIYTNRLELFGNYEIHKNLKLTYSYSHHDQDSYYGADFYQATQNIFFSNFIVDKKIEGHSLLGGLTIRAQHYDDNTVATSDSISGKILNKPDNQFIPGIFIQDEWEMHKDFTVLSGFRVDHFQKHGFILSPRLSAKYEPGEWTTLRSNFGTGFRVVNLFAEDHAFITGQRKVVIEEDLKPERSYNFSFNFNHVFSIGVSQGMFDLDMYYTYFSNKIIPDYETAGLIIYNNTKGHAITKGISANVTQEFSFPLNMNVGVNFQSATETEEETRRIEFAPIWSGIFSINYNIKSADILLGYTLKFTGPMQLPEVYDLDKNGQPLENPRPVESAPFAIHNFQVTKNFQNNFTIYSGIQNILNYRQSYSPLIGFNDPSTNPGFSEFFDTSYAYSTLHGREFYLGVKLSF